MQNINEKINLLAKNLGKEKHRETYYPRTGIGGDFYGKSKKFCLKKNNLRIIYGEEKFNDNSGHEFFLIELKRFLFRKKVVYYFNSSYKKNPPILEKGKWQKTLDDLFQDFFYKNKKAEDYAESIKINL